MTNANPSQESKSEFEKLSQSADVPLWQEFWQLIRENKVWWMLPIGIALGLLAILVMFASTGAAPFIYTLF